MIEERAIPWLVIPEHANAFWNLDIVEVLQSNRSDQPPLSVIVASQWPDDKPQFTGAWRVSFDGYRGYRLRSYGYPGNLPLARPDERSALWEMFPSKYLSEDSLSDGYSEAGSQRYHHFVICTGGNVVLEVIANAWSVEQVGAEWAHPFTYPVPQ